jgi:hypothetical protein
MALRLQNHIQKQPKKTMPNSEIFEPDKFAPLADKTNSSAIHTEDFGPKN